VRTDVEQEVLGVELLVDALDGDGHRVGAAPPRLAAAHVVVELGQEGGAVVVADVDLRVRLVAGGVDLGAELRGDEQAAHRRGVVPARAAAQLDLVAEEREPRRVVVRVIHEVGAERDLAATVFGVDVEATRFDRERDVRHLLARFHRVAVPRDLVERVAVRECFHQAALAQALVERAAAIVLLEQERAEALARDALDAEDDLDFLVVARPAARRCARERLRIHERARVEIDLAAREDGLDEAAEGEVAHELDRIELVEVVEHVVVTGPRVVVGTVAVRDDRPRRLLRDTDLLERFLGRGRLVDELQHLGELARGELTVLLRALAAEVVVTTIAGAICTTTTENREEDRCEPLHGAGGLPRLCRAAPSQVRCTVGANSSLHGGPGFPHG
jgi:hypothetical protein